MAAVGGGAEVGAWSADAAVTPEDVEATGGTAAPETSAALPSSAAVGGSRDPLVLGGEHAACEGAGSSLALFSSSDLGGTSGLALTALVVAADVFSSAFLSSCSFKSGVNSFARFFS